MNTLSYIDSMWIDILAWSIIHSLWQGMLIGGVVWVISSFSGATTARFQHNLHLSGLIGFFTIHLATIVVLYATMSGTGNSTIDPSLASVNGWTDSGVIAAVKDTGIWDMTIGAVSEHTGLIFFVWLSGMLFFSVKMVGQVSSSYFLRSTGISMCPPSWTASWKRILKNYKAGQKVTFRLSSIVESPVVTGFLKPVILFPVASVNHLSIDQVEAILHHELSHLARKDQWWNLFISLMETLYYYHPAVWFMTGQVRRERENSVDDRVLAMGVDPLRYAEALVTLQDIKKHHRHLALGAVGRKGELLQRIKRILGQPQKTNTMKQKLSSMLVIGLLVIAWGISSGFSEKAVDAETITVENVIVTDTIPSSVNGKVTVVDKAGVKTEMQVRNGKVVEASKNGKPVPESQLQELERSVELLPPPAPREFMVVTPPAPHAPLVPGLKFEGPKVDREIEVIVEDEGEDQKVIILENGEEREIRIMPKGEYEIIVDGMEWNSEGQAPEIFEFRIPDLDNIDLNLQGLTDEQLAKAKEELRKAKEELRGLKFEIREELEDVKDEKRRMEFRIQKEVEEGRDRMILRGPDVKYKKFDKGLFFKKRGEGSPLEQQLLKDGYIESIQDYSFKMNENRIKVDGKRITGEEYARYKRIYEKQIGKELPDEFNISIKKDQ